MSTKQIPKKLCELLDYNPKTGVFRWKESIASYKAGSEAGYICNHGYRRIGYAGTKYQAHRVAWCIQKGDCPSHMEIDHIDGVRDNNRIENLRLVSTAENARNVRLLDANTTGYVGIGWRVKYKKWRVRIGNVHLGTYANLAEAIKVRKEAEKTLNFHPNHGRT